MQTPRAFVPQAAPSVEHVGGNAPFVPAQYVFDEPCGKDWHASPGAHSTWCFMPGYSQGIQQCVSELALGVPPAARHAVTSA
jgi:hypothetical protein